MEDLEESSGGGVERVNEPRAITELVGGAGISALLSLAFLIYVARALGPAPYADVSAALSVLYLFSMALSPITPTISRFVALYAMRKETGRIVALHRRLANRVVRWTAIPALLAMLAAIPLQRQFHFASPLTVLMTVASIELFASISVDRGVLQGLTRFREHNGSTILESSLRLLAAMVALTFSRSAAMAMLSYAAGLLIATIVLRARFRLDWKGIAAEPLAFGEVLRFARPMILVMIAFAIQQNADMIAAKLWLPAAAAGLYGAASGLARVFAVITSPFFILMVPRITSLVENRQPIAGAAFRLCGWFLLISAVPLAVFAWRGAFLVRLSYGESFAPAAILIIPLSVLAIVSNLGLLLAQALSAAHRFAILRVYLTAAIVEVAALSVGHRTAQTIVYSVLAVQTSSVLIMSLVLLTSDQRSAAVDLS